MTTKRLTVAFTLLLALSTRLVTAQVTPFNVGGYAFLLDTSFYASTVVIRCPSYVRTAEELPAALCCHYSTRASSSADAYYFSGQNWTCPVLTNSVTGKAEHGVLSQNCHTETSALKSLSSYANQQSTLRKMADFCQQMKPSLTH